MLLVEKTQSFPIVYVIGLTCWVLKQMCPKGCRPSTHGYHTLTTIRIYVVIFGGKGEAGIVPSENNLRYGHVCKKFYCFVGWKFNSHSRGP